jgi:SpoVK/Ycf46/Vps4 family AAA+-type ATPase
MPVGWEKQPTDLKRGEAAGGRFGGRVPEQFAPAAERVEPDEPAEDGAAEPDRTDMFSPRVPRRSLEDLVVADAARRRIETSLNRIRFHEVLYGEWNLRKVDPRGSFVALNLYGPPGTGKTFCAEAIAHRLGRTFIDISYAEIESKYVGEPAKNIVAAFRKARATNSVIFFDEADSILGKRLTSVTQSADHGVNVTRAVMLKQLDEFDGIVIFATNLARNYDQAFVRRILAHIELELPDEPTRVKLWEYLLPREVPVAEDVNAAWLAGESAGLAGGDILNAVVEAAAAAVARPTDVRRVLRSDLAAAIEGVRVAKRKIGSAEPEVEETVTVQDKSELPPDVRERFEAVTSGRADDPK